MKGNLKGKIKKSLTGAFAGIIAVAMLVPATMTTFAADTVCHIGETYYATLAQAYSAAKDGDTIVIDVAEAGELANVAKIIKIDAGSTGFDLTKVTSENEEQYCVAVSGTVKSFAKHGEAADEGGVIFNWDTSKVPATATVTIKDANGHTGTPAPATVTSEPEEVKDSCDKDVEVKYTAAYETYTDVKTITIPAKGHKYELVDNDSGQSQWWDGASYDKNGNPVLKNVKVACVNEGDAAEAKDATTEFSKAEDDAQNPPTCSKPGKKTYEYKILYAGNYIKTKNDKGVEVDATITIVDESAPATGKHVKDEAVDPILEFKTYRMDGDKFLNEKGEVVDSKDKAEVIWSDNQYDADKAFELDGVLTYRLAWKCKDEADANYNFKEDEQTSAGTTKYFVGDKEEKAKTACTDYAETTFASVAYTVINGGTTQVKELTINPMYSYFEPEHAAIDKTKPGYTRTEPTHTTEGSESGVCSACGQTVTKVLPRAEGHTFAKDASGKETETKVDPTCTEMGYTYKVCTACQAAGIAAEHDASIAKDAQLPAEVLAGLPDGAVVTATTKANGHNYFLRNASDVTWDNIPANINIEKDDVICTIHYGCTRCTNEADVEYHLIKGEDTDSVKYSAITASTAKAAKCTETDKITFTVNDPQAKDLDTGKNVSKEVATDVIGPHAWKVTAANFSADGKSVNASLKCTNDKCPEAAKTIEATSTGALDSATGLTTYTASITPANLETAKIAAAEIDTTIPADQATKQIYDLTGATVTVKDYTETEYAAKQDKDVEVKIGNAVVDPKFYTVTWPASVTAPKLDAEVTVTATTVEDKGVTANGTSPKATFKVTKATDQADATAKLLVNGTEEKEKKEFTFDYNAKENTFVATTEAEKAAVSYEVAGKAAEAASFKDAGDYTFKYVITYADGTVYTSDAYTVKINKASVKITQKDYTKEYGTKDPEIVVESGKVFEGDDLGLKFEEHSEDVGTYPVAFTWDNKNYEVLPPTTASITDKDVLSLTITATDDTPKYTEKEYQEAVKAAEEAQAAAEAAQKKAEAAQKTADEAKKGTADAKAAQAKAEEAQKAAEEKNKELEKKLAELEKAAAVVKSEKFVVGNNIYKITNTTKLTAQFVGVVVSKKTVTIPDTAEYKGKTFKVNSIGGKALAKDTVIKKLTIGKNVKKIGKNAFNGAKKLKKITIKSTGLKKVSKNAFKGIYKKATVKVPKAKKAAYTKLIKKAGLPKKAKVK